MGGDLPELIGGEETQRLIDYADQVYLRFGADRHVEGLGNPEAVKEIRRRAIVSGLKLVDCPIRHLGTEKAQEVYLRIERALLEAGVQIDFACDCQDLLVENGRCLGARVRCKDGVVEERARCERW